LTRKARVTIPVTGTASDRAAPGGYGHRCTNIAGGSVYEGRSVALKGFDEAVRLYEVRWQE
jgi:hypothetical protein